jgi:peptidoglycan lytic transglycosylase G
VKFIAIILLLVLLLAGAAAYVILTPYGPTSETFVEVVPGSSTHAIAIQLARNGIIRTQYAFAAIRTYREFKATSGTLKAGEYRFDHPATPEEIYNRLLRGDVYTKALTIPEGYNIFDIAQAVEAAGFTSRADFLAAERANTALISDLNPSAASLEGYLFPDTYHFSRHATPLQILTAMTRRFRQTATQLGLHVGIPRVVLMASLIEKEVSQDSERALVAGVFVNRLAKGIPLATDPTVIYAALLEDRWRGTIYASDLANPSPYNTYRHTGLPPGPICNPGLAALKAAINPAQTDYLYFVADANGHSRFSTSLKEHNTNVQTYRNAVKAQH